MASLDTYISNLNTDADKQIIKTTLKNIRERIHTSKQFYKDFQSKFLELEGVEKLLALLKLHPGDEEVVDLLVSVLATCCMDKDNGYQVKELNGVTDLIGILRQYSHTSVSIINRSARALANLAKHVDITGCLEEDAVPLLVKALEETEDGGCCHSLMRVLKIFAAAKSKIILCSIIQCGGLRAVCTKLKSKDSKLVLVAIETAVALTGPFDKHKYSRRLSLPVSAANPVIENDSLSNLFSLLSHHKPEIQHCAWECISNLMSSDIGRAALGNAGFVKFYLATSKNEAIRTSVRERCAQYLCLCCQESVNRAKMFELEGLEFLMDLLDDSNKSVPNVSPALVVAAIAEFRYDTAALEKLAGMNLVKTLISRLQEKVKEYKPKDNDCSEDEEIDETSLDAKKKEESCRERRLKRKKKRKHKQKSKRSKIDEDDCDITDISEQSSVGNKWLLPTKYTTAHQQDTDEGFSPQYPTHWYPESPRMSPGSYPNLSGSSPLAYYPSGMSPQRAHCSGGASPLGIDNPMYQFSSCMLSPPKSDSASPGSSPPYYYDPLSPQKYFGCGEEVFSPVVSEASDSESSCDGDSVTVVKQHIEIDELNSSKSKKSRKEIISSDSEQRNILEQATRRLTLQKDSETSLHTGSSRSSDAVLHSLEAHQGDGPRETDSDLTRISLSTRKDQKGKEYSGKANAAVSASGDMHVADEENMDCTSLTFQSPTKQVSQIDTASMSSSSTLSSAPRTARIPSSPRLSTDSDKTDVNKTPSKSSSRSRSWKEEEENVLLILQEVILLHRVPTIAYITTETTMQTLLDYQGWGPLEAARVRCDVVLRDILSERFFFDKLVSHKVPCLIHRHSNRRMKGVKQSQSHSKNIGSKSTAKSSYLTLMQDIADSTFGHKEVEHLLLGQEEHNKLPAAISLPYIFSSQTSLKRMLLDCKALEVLLDEVKSTTQTPSECSENHHHVMQSLHKLSFLILPSWQQLCDRDDKDDDSSESVSSECFYKAQVSSTDIKLICEGGATLRAHRQILAARSEYFSCLLSGSFQEAGEETIHLKGIHSESMIFILHNLYDCQPHQCNVFRSLSGKSLGSILDILRTAKYYMTSRAELSECVTQCVLETEVTHALLVHHLSRGTVQRLSKFAALHHCHMLFRCCLLYILRSHRLTKLYLQDLVTSEFGEQVCNGMKKLFTKALTVK